jgi:hypothetical protein
VDLAERRRGLENALTELFEAIGNIRRQAVDETVIREALGPNTILVRFHAGELLTLWGLLCLAASTPWLARKGA